MTAEQMSKGMRRGIGILVAAAGVASWLHFCGTSGFREEVQLGTGEVIQVERVIGASRLGELGGPGGWESQYNSVAVVATSTGDPPPIWESREGLVPMLIDRDTNPGGGWYLVATFYTCGPWRALGRPKLPYAEFRMHEGRWIRAPLSPELIGREANILTTVSSNGENSPLTLNDKARRNSDPRISRKYLRIVDRWTTHC